MTVELKHISVKPISGIFTAELYIMHLPCAYVIYSPTITLIDPFPGSAEILEELAQQQGLKDLTVYVRELFRNYADNKFGGNLKSDADKGFIIMNSDSLQYTLYHVPGFNKLAEETKLALEEKISRVLPYNAFIFNSIRPTAGV